MSFRDYYATLGVERDTNKEALRKAYRGLARKYHPDVSEEPDADVRFREVAEAYDVLKDDTKRALYDKYGEHWKAVADGRVVPPEHDPRADFQAAGFDPSGFGGQHGGGFDPEDLGSMFETFFREEARRPRPGSDVEARLRLSLEEASAGGKKSLRIAVGAEPKDLDVNVPAGVADGQRLRLRGEGAPGRNAPPGDLLLRIEIAPHDTYRLDGKDLHATLRLAPWEAVLGAEVAQPTLHGEVKLKVPPGTAAGRTIRLKGRGYGKEGDRGDLLLQTLIVVPGEISDAERESWVALRDASDFQARGEPS